jgi:hypothetical protein
MMCYICDLSHMISYWPFLFTIIIIIGYQENPITGIKTKIVRIVQNVEICIIYLVFVASVLPLLLRHFGEIISMLIWISEN